MARYLVVTDFKLRHSCNIPLVAAISLTLGMLLVAYLLGVLGGMTFCYDQLWSQQNPAPIVLQGKETQL